VFTAALLDNPLPWTKMRQVYALLGLVKKWGPDRVELACASALESIDVDSPHRSESAGRVNLTR
jgi:hypothetical protein